MTDRVYKHGLPFNETLGINLMALMDRIEKKKASMLIIDGGVGEGKTTLAVHCADHVMGRHINFKEQYAMGGVPFQEKLEICHNLGYVVVIYDEAGDFSKRGALTSFNKRLNRIFDTYRAYKILVIIVLPCFNVLEDHLFNLKVPRMLLNCYGRTNKQGNFRAYSLYRMHYIRYRMANKKLVIKEYAYNQVDANFKGQFLDLSSARSKELDKISIEGKKQILSENILESRGLINIKTLMRKLHRSNAWVRNKIKKNKIKHVQIYRKSKYYEANVIETLRDELGGLK